MSTATQIDIQRLEAVRVRSLTKARELMLELRNASSSEAEQYVITRLVEACWTLSAEAAARIECLEKEQAGDPEEIRAAQLRAIDVAASSAHLPPLLTGDIWEGATG